MCCFHSQRLWLTPGSHCPRLLTAQRRGGMLSGLPDLGLAPARIALLRLGGQGCWPGEGRSQFLGQEQEGRGSAAEARMTVLPASGREGQRGQTTARQEGCAFFGVSGGGWAARSLWAWQTRPESAPAAEQPVQMVTREPGL